MSESREPYETIESKSVFTGMIIEVKQDIITLPNGKTTGREIVVRGEATAVVPIDENNNVILVKQYRHPIGKVSLEIPAGMLEEGEDLETCALRELEEETALKGGKITHISSFYPTLGFCTEKIHLYLVTDLSEGTLNLDEDEFVEVHKMPLDDAIALVYNGEIIDGKTIIGLLACKKHLQQ